MAAGDRVYIADKPTLDEVNTKTTEINTKVGSDSDTSAGTTLFSRVKNIVASIGRYNDAATSASSSLFGKINYIVQWLTGTRGSKIDSIGTTTDSTGTSTNGTIMGKLNSLINKLANTETTVYTASDTQQNVILQNYNIEANATYTEIATWTPEYSGTVRLKLNVISTSGQPGLDLYKTDIFGVQQAIYGYHNLSTTQSIEISRDICVVQGETIHFLATVSNTTIGAAPVMIQSFTLSYSMGSLPIDAVYGYQPSMVQKFCSYVASQSYANFFPKTMQINATGVYMINIDFTRVKLQYGNSYQTMTELKTNYNQNYGIQGFCFICAQKGDVLIFNKVGNDTIKVFEFYGEPLLNTQILPPTIPK